MATPTPEPAERPGIQITLTPEDGLYQRAKNIADLMPIRINGCGYHEAFIARAVECLEYYQRIDRAAAAPEVKP